MKISPRSHTGYRLYLFNMSEFDCYVLQFKKKLDFCPILLPNTEYQAPLLILRQEMDFTQKHQGSVHQVLTIQAA